MDLSLGRVEQLPLSTKNNSLTNTYDSELELEQEEVVNVLAIEGGAGLGKSTQSIDKAIKKHKNIEVYVPTHALAIEASQRLLQKHTDVVVTCIRGRSFMADDKEHLCKRHDVIKQLNEIQCFSVYGLMCCGGSSSSKTKCEYHDKCEYINQFDDPREKIYRPDLTYVRYYPHAYLRFPRSQLDDNNPTLAILDETFLSDMELASDCERQGKGYGQCRWKSEKLINAGGMLELIATTLKDEEQLLPTLHKAYPDLRSDIAELQTQYEVEVPNISPDMDDADCESRINNIAVDFDKEMNFAPLLEVLAKAVNSDVGDTQTIWYDKKESAVCINGLRNLDRLKNTQILIIDGTMNFDAIEKIVDHVDYEKIAPKRKYQGHTIQVYNHPMSQNKLTPSHFYKSKKGSSNKYKESFAKAESNKLAIEQKLQNIADTMGDGLVVSSKKFKEELTVPKGCQSTHFGNLRGKNQWEHLNWVVVIGRNQPRFEVCENIARAYYGNDPNPLKLTGGKVERRTVGYRIRGGWKEGVAVDYHKDDRVRSFIYQIREAETEQAIDRIRLIQNKEEQYKPVHIISNVPVNVKIDTLMTFDEWTGEADTTILHRAWASGIGVDAGNADQHDVSAGLTKCDGYRVMGVLPLSAIWLWDKVGGFEERFGTMSRSKGKDKVEKLIAKIWGNPQNPYIYSICNLGVDKYYEIQVHKGIRKRCLSLWGKEETLKILSVLHGSEASPFEEKRSDGKGVGGEGSGTSVGPPKNFLNAILTDSLSLVNIRTMFVAYTAGLKLGGWCCTNDHDPALVPRYPLLDAQTNNPTEVLIRNIRCSDGTLILDDDPKSEFTKLRMLACEEQNRPYLVVPYIRSEKTAAKIKKWIASEKIEVLFVSSGSTSIPKQLKSVQRMFRSVFGKRLANRK
jgi:hypothetical protein